MLFWILEIFGGEKLFLEVQEESPHGGL